MFGGLTPKREVARRDATLRVYGMVGSRGIRRFLFYHLLRERLFRVEVVVVVFEGCWGEFLHGNERDLIVLWDAGRSTVHDGIELIYE